jgi:hypothetical protein
MKISSHLKNDSDKLKAIRDSLKNQRYRQTSSLSGAKLDQSFNSFVFNVNTLDGLYKEYFTENLKMPPGLTQSEKNAALIEHKNRNFKDLYNLIEESMMKFYDLYVEAQSLKMKNVKLEETF